MVLVVFLRGVNVGGRKTFSPAQLARDLASFDVVNVGAAGTFVVRQKVARAVLRAAFAERLPFDAQLMICRGDELLGLAREEAVHDDALDQNSRRFLSVMTQAPRKPLALPLAHPPGGKWQVKIVEARGRFVLSIWRQQGRTFVYPNEVVERNFGIPATTRTWSTIETVCRIVERSPPDFPRKRLA